MTTKLIQEKTNKRGIQYALGTDGDTYSVLKLCHSYASYRRGGMAQRWRYVQKDMTLDAAMALFNRRGA